VVTSTWANTEKAESTRASCEHGSAKGDAYDICIIKQRKGKVNG